jgi:hypothetical protein
VTGTGTNNYVTYWTGTSTIAGEAQLATSRGGTGLNTSASTGVPTISAGTWSVAATLGVAQGGTGAATFTSNGVLYGNGAGAIQATAAGTSAQFLVANGSGVPVFVSMSSDVLITNAGVATIQANAVALGTDTTGNYVATVSTSALTGITGGAAGSEGTAITLGFDYSATLAANPALATGNAVFGTTGLIFEGATADTFEGLLTVTDPTADNTWTLPNVSGTVITTGNLTSITATGTITSGTWNGTAIGAQYGGTGLNTSASTGVPTISSGTWSVASSLGVTLGGTGTTTQFTQGSIVFAGASGVYTQDNANFFWDDTNNRLGLGTTSPGAMLSLYGASNALRLSYDGSNYNTISTTSTGEFLVSSSNTSESQILVGSGGAVDTSIAFDGSANDYFSGVDNTTGSYMIGSGFTVQSGNAFLTITSGGLIGINMTPVARFDVTHSSTNTTGATEYSQRNTFSDTGVVTTGTDTTYGDYVSVTRTGATGGTINTIGSYITATADTAGAGTATLYGNLVNATGADTTYGVYSGVTATSSATASYGIASLVTDATTGATVNVGAAFAVSDTGVVTTGTDTSYGTNTTVTRTGATGGTITSYGSLITINTDNAGAGTSTAYGSYIDTGVAGATNADTVYGQYISTEANAGTAYGLYVDAGAGAGTEYAGIFMNGNVGIGTATPTSLFSVGASSQFQVNSTGAIAAATGITSSGNITFSAFTSGSVPFFGAAGLLSQDNSNFFWDNSTKRLGIGTASPGAMLSLYGTSNALRLSYDGSNYNTVSTTSTGGFSVVSSNVSESRVIVGNGSAVDSSISFDGNSNDYFSGVDNTTGSYMIGSGFTVQSGNAFLTITSGGLIGINMTPVARFDVTHSSTNTTGATEYSQRNTFSDTGVVTTGTDTTYGDYVSVTRTGATGGTINSYGEYVTLVTDNAGSGTSTAYGSYIDTGVAGATNADTVYGQYISTEANAGTAYGLYVDAGTGAGTEYAGIFMNGNVGIGIAAPAYKIRS